MSLEFERKPVEFEGETYFVPTYFSGKETDKHGLVFSPGFALPGKYIGLKNEDRYIRLFPFLKQSKIIHFDKLPFSRDYGKLVPHLNEKMRNNGGLKTMVPQIIGTKIKSQNGLIYPNDTHEKCVDLYRAFCEQHASGKNVAEIYQSLGAQSSGPMDFNSNIIILINPLVEVGNKYNKWGFVSRALQGSLIKETLFTLTSAFGYDFALNFIGNFKNNFKCLEDLTSLKNEYLFPKNLEANLLSLNGVFSKNQLRDQFSDYTNFKDFLEGRYASVEVKFIYNSSHDGFLYHPKKYAGHIVDHILKHSSTN